MSASNPLINSPHSALGRYAEPPYIGRPKRSDSVQFDPSGPRGAFGPAASRLPDLNDEATFIPTSLGEHLLERTYLEDVVRPLVRALVQARMTHTANGNGAAESSQAYVDLEKLRRELERSTQRARHAEQERDDLARRLDLAGVPDAPRERAERQSEHPGQSDHSSSRSQQPSSHMMGAKRPRPGDYEPRSSAPGSNAVSVNVAHGDGPGASITVTTEAPHNAPISMTSRPHHGAGVEQMSPPTSYAAQLGAARHRPYADMHQDAYDGEARHLTRIPIAREADYAYADDRPDRYSMPPNQAPHRPPLVPHYGARSPQSSSAYLTSSSERSSMPTLTTYPSTSSSTSFTPANSYAHYEHEIDDLERSRKRHHASDMDPPSHAANRNSFMLTPSSSEPANYPIRKLASTKNRTCSSCAAPHDAKFRRGPNGPGTLCDRCGSRWKKFKEQEAAGKRDSQYDAVGAANAAAQARLSSASSSSESPMEPTREEGEKRAEGAVGGEAQRERERSASVDQLADD